MSGVAIVGSHVFGVYMRCDQLPEPGETVLGHDFDSMVHGDGGKGSNQAMCAARLGEPVAFIGKVGVDNAGDVCVNTLRSNGINCDHVCRSQDSSTGASIVLIDAEGSSLIVVDPAANDEITEAELEAAKGLIQEHSVLLTQFELPPAVVRWATTIGRRLGLTTILNPAPVPNGFEEALASVDLITPNEHEALQMLNVGSAGDHTPLQLCREISARFNVSNVIVTLGSRGAVGVFEGDSVEVPAPKIEQRNSVGAGDGFNAGLAVAMARSFNWEESIQFACAVGAFTAANEMAPWNAYPDREQLREFLCPRDKELMRLAERVFERAAS